MTILIADEIDILLTNLSEKNLKVLYQFFELPGMKGGRERRERRGEGRKREEFFIYNNLFFFF